jgi:hypothetical protein
MNRETKTIKRASLLAQELKRGRTLINSVVAEELVPTLLRQCRCTAGHSARRTKSAALQSQLFFATLKKFLRNAMY